MDLNTINSVDDVIVVLEDIILEAKVKKSPLGYFAALYQSVTIKVKDGIETNFFDDADRMADLDVVFAKRYIKAYYDYHSDKAITASWQEAFDASTHFWPIVLQHLLLGMNAHISLDLGIAAAEISKGKNITELHADFIKINNILSALVGAIQERLAEIWPNLKKLLSKSKDVDDFLIDFSMELARDGAWAFAKELSEKPLSEWERCIATRDQAIAKKAKIVTDPGFIGSIIFGVIRLGESGSVSKRIRKLQDDSNK